MYPKYKGYEIKPSSTADKEMAHLKIYLDDVLTILEEGNMQVYLKENLKQSKKHFEFEEE